MKKPTVSVIMITYAHEKYIEQAINGILIQECNFEVEIIIADDCSPDNTEEVINAVIRNHPKGNWINYVKQEKNIGALTNFVVGVKEANGKYIALCEGDDYWTDPLKLQKQVDFMEANSNVGFCFTGGTIFDVPANTYTEKTIDFENGVIDVNHFIELGPSIFFTASVMVRANIMDAFIEDLDSQHFKVGDLPLMLSACINGDIGFIKDPTCVYRLGSEGSWTERNKSFDNFHMGILDTIGILHYYKNKSSDEKITKSIGKQINKHYNYLVLEYIKRNRNIVSQSLFYLKNLRGLSNKYKVIILMTILRLK